MFLVKINHGDFMCILKFFSVFKTWFPMCSLAFFGFSFLNAQTFSPARLNTFYDLFVADQKIIVDNAFHRPRESEEIPPRGMLNYVPLVITNHTGIDASQLYVMGKGQTLAATDAYFLQPDLTTGVCSLVSSETNNSADPSISVKLSSLPSAGPNSYYVYVPQMISGRFYISVGTPLYMETLFTGGLHKINDPSQTTVQDPNYYTLYQDFEFTLDANYDLYTNVTNVDYFSLPLTLGSHTYPSGKAYPTLDNLTVVGYPMNSTRKAILNGINAGLLSDASSPPQWPSLTIPFYSDPYTAGAPLTDLRILAAKLSIALGLNGVQFVGADPANVQTFFSANYLQTPGPYSSDYMTQLYNYYNVGGNQLQVTIFPKNYPAATYTMTSTSTPLELQLVSTSPGAVSPITINLGNLTTASLFDGAVGEWVAEHAITPEATDPWQTEIAKIISALFTAGMLPPNSTVAQPIVANSTFFSSYRSSYFSNPSGFFSQGPLYNLYDQAIHPLLIQTGGFGLGYAYDFDDLLDLAGLLHVNVQTAGVLNPYQPYVVLTAGLIDTPIPNPTSNFGPYTLEVGLLALESNPIDIIYSTDPSVSPNITYSLSTTSTGTLNSLHNQFLVRYYKNPSKTEYLTYQVYPKYQLVLPTTTRYNAEDVTLMNGIVFLPGTDGTTFSINVPNTYLFP